MMYKIHLTSASVSWAYRWQILAREPSLCNQPWCNLQGGKKRIHVHPQRMSTNLCLGCGCAPC